VSVGASELTEHEAIEPVRLPARSAEPVTRGLDLIRVHSQHPQPFLEEPLDQHTITSFDRDDINVKQSSASHNAVIPCSSCANVSASSRSPAASAIRTSCFSDAQSIPA
jgi:hypothetical protein